MIACYCRVSTVDQSIDRQISSTQEYARSKLDVELADIEIFRDKSTGTNTKRDGYQRMMEQVERGNVDAVVVDSTDRIARSIRDLDRTVDRIVNEHDTPLYIISEGFEIEPDNRDPYQTAMLRLLGVFAELEAQLNRKRVKEGIAAREQNDDYHHGKAPLGFGKDNGRLVESENYDEVVTVLEMVQKNNLSKRKAAKQLGCARATIRRALERAEVYGL